MFNLGWYLAEIIDVALLQHRASGYPGSKFVRHFQPFLLSMSFRIKYFFPTCFEALTWAMVGKEGPHKL